MLKSTVATWWFVSVTCENCFAAGQRALKAANCDEFARYSSHIVKMDEMTT